ncbi:DUF1259 domain-containing protein [Mesorhizobium calcicola]|uniref:DUF1259 domain-containing protein n=1 Tax=Mesorhizobium calcicola TaxID=1300310 RepID=A0ABW4WD38_9HYPH
MAAGDEADGSLTRVSVCDRDLETKLPPSKAERSKSSYWKPSLFLRSPQMQYRIAPLGAQAMVMGDLVLTQDEVSPVMKEFAQQGLEITALHNHLLRAEPATLYMHVSGQGDPLALAKALHAGLALSKTPLGDATAATPQPAAQATGLDTAAIDKIIGFKGKDSNGVYQFGIPRAEPIKQDGMDIPAAMGSAIAINFQPTGDGKAAITGDFLLAAKEVNPVIKAMRDNGIEVTALHNHMLNEEPRVFFMHFWANNDAEKLARGLRAALDQVDVRKG